jgi:hypothetical protein
VVDLSVRFARPIERNPVNDGSVSESEAFTGRPVPAGVGDVADTNSLFVKPAAPLGSSGGAGGAPPSSPADRAVGPAGGS